MRATVPGNFDRESQFTRTSLHELYARPVLVITNQPTSHFRASSIKETIVKIVVIGGTGLIGSKLVGKLREQGQDAIAASPNSGVNTLTGEGLNEVLKGASVVVDVVGRCGRADFF
jgi:hypothetical protein